MVSLLSQSGAEKLNGQRINESTQQIHARSPVWPSPFVGECKTAKWWTEKEKKLKELLMSSYRGRSQTFISGYNRHL